MVVSKMPVWAKLQNLPLHLWHHNVLITIGNLLGKFLKTDEDRISRGILTFIRICIEVDLSEGLPESINLKFNNTQWTQPLDYENTTFWWCGCLQIGHLHSTCPKAKQTPKWNKKQQKQPKGWQCTTPWRKKYKKQKQKQRTKKTKKAH